jgi:hypothetical protein
MMNLKTSFALLPFLMAFAMAFDGGFYVNPVNREEVCRKAMPPHAPLHAVREICGSTLDRKVAEEES